MSLLKGTKLKKMRGFDQGKSADLFRRKQAEIRRKAMVNNAGWLSQAPDTADWYAVCFCWDPQEGMFPDALFWDGFAWRDVFSQICESPIVLRSPHSFDNYATAHEWAHEHDPE